jgi:hypothetical protein
MLYNSDSLVVFDHNTHLKDQRFLLNKVSNCYLANDKQKIKNKLR